MQMEVIPSGNNVFLNFTSSTFIVFLIELSIFFFFLFLWRVGVVVRLRRRGMRTLWTRVYLNGVRDGKDGDFAIYGYESILILLYFHKYRCCRLIMEELLINALQRWQPYSWSGYYCFLEWIALVGMWNDRYCRNGGWYGVIYLLVYWDTCKIFLMH